MALLVVMLLLALTVPLLFLSMRTDEMDAVAAGVVILAPSLFYTSLLASATTGTNRARWGYRLVGLAMTAGYLFYFSSQVPNQAAAVVLTVAGIAYCLLVDVFAPHCTGETASWRYLCGNTSEPRNAVMEMTGKVPAGLNVDSAGDLWGVPTTGGSFTLNMWDAKTMSIRDVTYDVTVVAPGAVARPNSSTSSGSSAKPGNTTGSLSKDALSKRQAES
ncbi:hypothetical protein [Arthrobacter sp. Cr_A7]|uniref:hypothetical protein n=1 Tax=Arthrobacter sp. Cr_A7 TaxID=3031017 RepID=UPI0023DBD13E|nr:hypothetical protein [Arthrobacter sp. Cr_A7]MDF2048868.1 hypothetical protein [Arthrobacter sp. Cr_A7]